MLFAYSRSAWYLRWCGSRSQGVIFWQRADNWIALFASLSLIAFGTSSLPPSLPALADQFSSVWLPIQLLALIGTVALYVFYLLFPNGRFIPGWTRWAVVLRAAHEAFYWLFPKSIFNIASSFPLLDFCCANDPSLSSP